MRSVILGNTKSLGGALRFPNSQVDEKVWPGCSISHI